MRRAWQTVFDYHIKSANLGDMGNRCQCGRGSITRTEFVASVVPDAKYAGR